MQSFLLISFLFIDIEFRFFQFQCMNCFCIKISQERTYLIFLWLLLDFSYFITSCLFFLFSFFCLLFLFNPLINWYLVSLHSRILTTFIFKVLYCTKLKIWESALITNSTNKFLKIDIISLLLLSALQIHLRLRATADGYCLLASISRILR